MDCGVLDRLDQNESYVNPGVGEVVGPGVGRWLLGGSSLVGELYEDEREPDPGVIWGILGDRIGVRKMEDLPPFLVTVGDAGGEKGIGIGISSSIPILCGVLITLRGRGVGVMLC